MAENEPTATWRNPYWGTLSGDLSKLRPIFESLSNFLARPTFYNGVDLGDGTGSSDRTLAPPATRIDTTTFTGISDSLAGLGTDLTTVYATLATMASDITSLETDPIDGTRITSNSIDTGQLRANSITAAKLAAINIGVGKWIASTSYSAGVSGWIIDAAGTAEFNNVTVRGTVVSNNYLTQGSGARVRIGTGAGTTGTDEVQFLGASGGVGSIRNAEFTLGYATSMRLSAGGIIDLYNNGSANRVVITAAGGVDVNGTLATAAINATGQIFTTADFVNSGGLFTGAVSCASVSASGNIVASGSLVGSLVTTSISGLGSTVTINSTTLGSSGALSTASVTTNTIVYNGQTVSKGAAGSGGTGFAVLRVPN